MMPKLKRNSRTGYILECKEAYYLTYSYMVCMYNILLNSHCTQKMEKNPHFTTKTVKRKVKRFPSQSKWMEK